MTLGISTKHSQNTVFYNNGNVVVRQPTVLNHESYVGDMTETTKGPNQPLVNGFRKPTNLTKSSDGRSPGVGGPVSFSGLFYLSTSRRSSSATTVTERVVSLDLERHMRWRDGELSSFMHHQLMNAARADALVNLKNRNVSVGLMLAELHKSVDTVQGYLNDIVGGMVSVRKRSKDAFSKLMTGRYTPATERRLARIRNRKQHASERKRLDAVVGSEYLRYKYGVMPSVYDAEGLIKSYDTLADKTLTIRARSRKLHSFPARQDINIPIGSWSNPRIVGTLSGTFEAACSVTIYATVRSDGLRSLSKVGFDAATIAEITWDLTPFSFILDHVLPVANMIQAWSAMAGLDFKAGTESTHYSIKNMQFSGSLLESGVAYESTVKINGTEPYRLVRNALSSTPFPMPYMVNPFSLNNAATWASLLGALRK